MFGISAQMLASGTVAAISFIVVVILGRTMGPDRFGEYSYALTLLSLFAILQDGGFKSIIYREETTPTQSLNPEHSAFSAGFNHLMQVTLLGFFVSLGLWFISKPAATLATGVACFAFVTLTEFVSARFQAQGRFGRDAIWKIAVRASSALIMLLVLREVSTTPIAMFAAWGLGVGICLLFCLPLLDKPRISSVFASPFFKASLSLMFIHAATTIYHKVDIVMLEALQGQYDVGIYAAAYRFLDGIILLSAPISVVLFRKMRKAKDNPELLQKTVLIGMVATLVVAGAIFMVTMTFAKPIIEATYGGTYSGSAEILVILFLALIFIMPNAILTQAAIAINAERAYALIAISCAVINTICNGYAIPQHGPVGAAWVTVITEGVLAASLIVLLGIRTRSLSSNA